MLELNKIHTGDCIELMEQLPDYSVDISLTDPPYNMGIDYGKYYNDSKSEDKYTSWCKEWFNILYKKVKDKVIFTCGNKNLPMWLEIKRPTVILCWHRQNSSSHVGLNLFNNWEPILLYSKTTSKINAMRDFYSFYVESGICRPKGERIEHYCPKPIKLWRKLILDYSNEGDVVIDPFIGSGTTAVACKELGRDYLGIDINQNYVDIADRKVQQTNYTGSPKYTHKSFRI